MVVKALSSMCDCLLEIYSKKTMKEKLTCIPLKINYNLDSDYKREENEFDSPLCLKLGSSW